MNINKLVNRLNGHQRVFFLSLFVLMFLRCDTKELEFIQPYQFVSEEFDSITELPPVEDPDPEVAEPELPLINEPAQTQLLFQDLNEAENDEDVDETTLTILEKVEAFILAKPDETAEAVQEQAELLSEDDISAFFDEEFEFSADLLELAASAKEDLDIGSLFTSLLIPIELVEIDFGGRKDLYTALEKDMFLENLRTATLVGPCAEAARAASRSAGIRLEASRNAQLENIEATYQRRLTEAEQRLASRNAAALSLYQSRLIAGQAIITSILGVANKVARFNRSLASRYRYYAFVYMINLRTVYAQSYTLSIRANQAAYEREIGVALSLRSQVGSEVDENYNVGLININNLLRDALNNCHNQGAGN
jgi:hypothetical protein